MTHPPIQLSDRISHDFRTPLTVIKEYASIIRDGVVGDVNSRQTRMLNVIDDRADDIHLLVENLLFLANPDASPEHVDRRRVDLGEVVRLALSQTEPRCRLVGCQLHLTAHNPEQNECYGDDKGLAQAVRNVISFALKHRGEAADIVVRLENDECQRNLLVSIPVVLDADSEAASSLRPVDLGVGLDVAEQLCRLSLGQLSIRRFAGDDGQPAAEVELSLPVFKRDVIVPRYLDWLNGSPTALDADVLVVEDPQPGGNAGRPTSLESTLRYVLEGNELLMELGESSWLVVSPRCINRLDLIDRITELNAQLGRDCPMKFARRDAPLNQGAQVVLATVDEMTESSLAV